VWTFAEHLAGGWFARGGEWAAVRGLVDVLGASARAVVDDVRAADAPLGALLDLAVQRSLVVIELALGGLLAERLREVDAELVTLQTEAQDTAEITARESLATLEQSGERTSERLVDRFIDRPTIPFLRPDRPTTSPGVSAEVLAAVAKAITLARARVAPDAALIGQALGAIESVATDTGGNFAAAVLSARELYGARSVDEAGVMPLFDALDQARALSAASVHQLRVPHPVRLRALRAISTALQRLVGATTGLALEAAAPFTERLREAQGVTAELRAAVARSERRRADLERRFASDPAAAWGGREPTQW